jgi:hypothetical protein
MGRNDRAVPLPIQARGLPHNLAEGSAKCPDAAEAHVEANVCHGSVTLAQQKHRALDPSSLQVAMGRLAEHGAEAPTEMGG